MRHGPNRAGKLGAVRVRFLAAGDDPLVPVRCEPGRDEGLSGSDWRSLQDALRAEYSAARKARPDRTGQRLRRLAKATGLSRTDVDLLELVLRYQAQPVIESMIDDVFRADRRVALQRGRDRRHGATSRCAANASRSFGSPSACSPGTARRSSSSTRRNIEIDEGVVLDELDGLLVRVDDEWNVDVATGQPHAWDVDPASGRFRPLLGVVRVPFRARRGTSHCGQRGGARARDRDRASVSFVGARGAWACQPVVLRIGERGEKGVKGGDELGARRALAYRLSGSCSKTPA